MDCELAKTTSRTEVTINKSACKYKDVSLKKDIIIPGDMASLL